MFELLTAELHEVIASDSKYTIGWEGLYTLLVTICIWFGGMIEGLSRRLSFQSVNESSALTNHRERGLRPRCLTFWRTLDKYQLTTPWHIPHNLHKHRYDFRTCSLAEEVLWLSRITCRVNEGLQEFSKVGYSNYKHFFCNINRVPKAMVVEKELSNMTYGRRSSALIFCFTLLSLMGRLQNLRTIVGTDPLYI